MVANLLPYKLLELVDKTTLYTREWIPYVSASNKLMKPMVAMFSGPVKNMHVSVLVSGE